MFSSRQEAAAQIAKRLEPYRGRNPLVLAIPRGGVPMGRIIADALGGELDVMLVHKLGAPRNPELAIGSVDESGRVELNEVASWYQIEQAYIDQEVQQQLARLKARRERYGRPPANPKGRLTIVVDDGVATGATLMAALRTLREQGPERLVAGIAVAPPDTAERIRELVDELVCLQTPEPFMAVGAFFADFSQVTDDEVVALLGAESP